MRTPLNAIVGMNDLLRDTSLNSEQAEMVKAMHEASQSMLKLIENVLDIPRSRPARSISKKPISTCIA